MVRPEDFDRRIPAYHTHAALGAVFDAVFDGAAVWHYEDPAAERVALDTLAFIDLSALPRCGLKNEGTPQWLASRGVVVPDVANRAARQADGGLCARLGGTDILVTSDPFGYGTRPRQLLVDWAADPERPKGWDAHREDGFCWFFLIGSRAPDFWSRVCSVDMRPAIFRDLQIAQTRIFGLGGIIVRADIGGLLGYNLFFDIASSDYLIHCVLAVMAEFGGRMAGLSTLRMLDGRGELPGVSR